MSSNIDQIYVFGDSLSDTGNVLTFTGGQFPNTPYAPGRFSNDDIWTDYFTDELDLDVPPVTKPFSGDDGLNFAIGGATSGDDNIGVVPLGLEQQTDAFELLTKLQSSEDLNKDLFSLWVGANDYFSYIQDDPNTTDVVETNFPESGKDANRAVMEVVDTNIGGAVHDIIDAGGENILLFDLPDLDRIPLAQNLTEQDRNKLGELTDRHNERLSNLVGEIETSNPNVNIIEVGINDLFDRIRENPNKFGFTNATDNFTGIDIVTEINQPPAMGNPDEFVFWDSVHPTTATHELVADLVIQELSNEGVI